MVDQRQTRYGTLDIAVFDAALHLILTDAQPGIAALDELQWRLQIGGIAPSIAWRALVYRDLFRLETDDPIVPSTPSVALDELPAEAAEIVRRLASDAVTFLLGNAVAASMALVGGSAATDTSLGELAKQVARCAHTLHRRSGDSDPLPGSELFSQE